MNKVYSSSADAVAGIPDGATIMFGGWALVGNAENLIRALYEKGTKDIIAIANNPGVIEKGVFYDLAILIQANRVRRFIGSYHGWNYDLMEKCKRGEMEYECIPQGTLAERIRAAGAGLGGFYTRAGANSLMADGKEKRIFDGKQYVLERPLYADYALIKAKTGDKWGNLIYRYTAQNFNPVMAMAGKITIAEVEDLREIGELDPNQIHTPGIFVDRIVKGEAYVKRV